MHRFCSKALLAAVISFTFVACGPGAQIGNGKQGAAEALYLMSKPSKASADKSATPVDIGVISWGCPEAGDVKLTGVGVEIGFGGTTSVAQKLTVGFERCGLAKTDQGTAEFNGPVTLTQQIAASGTDVAIVQKIKGKVTVNGAFDDFVDVDVEQRILAGDLLKSGQVSMHVTGTVTTKAGTFSFDEDLTIEAGKLSYELKKS